MNTIQRKLLQLFLFLFTTTIFAQSAKVEVLKDQNGAQLLVNGEKFMMNGMNWDYIPIGTNTVNAAFWKNPMTLSKQDWIQKCPC